MNVFAYGSLMFPEVWRRVAGDASMARPAVLTGYRRFAVRDRTFPGIVADADAQVKGVVYRDVSPEAVARLDVFEDEMYERLKLPVTLLEGAVLPCEVYVVTDPYRHWLADSEWDPAVFERDHLSRFLSGDESD